MTIYEQYPNVMRLAREIAKSKHPHRAANALASLLTTVADETTEQDPAAKWDRLARLTPEDIRKGATK